MTPVKGPWKGRTRAGIAWAMNVCGLLPLYAIARMRGRAVVLMYHRVLSKDEALPWEALPGMTVEAKTFARHLRLLSRYARPVSLSRFIHYLEHGAPFPDRTCLVTFDDGWRDNFTNAFPILQETAIPAVVFLTTDFIGSARRFWQQELSRLIAVAHERYCANTGFSEGTMKHIYMTELRRVLKKSQACLQDRIADFLKAQKKQPLAETQELIDALSKLLPEAQTRESKSVFLNWDDVKIMASHGIAFGSHGKSHALLTVLEPDQAEREICESKQILERTLGQNIEAFSYPNGNWSRQLTLAVRRHGYRAAFGTEPGFVRPGSDLYRIRRINIHQDMTETLPLFLARVTGLW